MAKKKTPGRPAKADGKGKMVRIDPRYASMARAVAVERGLTIGDYLVGIAGDAIERDYLAVIRKLERKTGGEGE